MKYILIILLFASCSSNNAEVSNCQNKVDSLQAKVDSLHDELFIKHVELCRYEITLEILKERDSVAAQKFEEIMYTETE